MRQAWQGKTCQARGSGSQHRAALEALGDRIVELVRTGALPETGIGPELATVEAKLMEIDAKSAEIVSGEDHTPPSPRHLGGL